nr:NUDIX hydrolase [uncultured Desulfobacter sp.]
MISELYLYACELPDEALSDPQKRAGQRVGAYLARKKIPVDMVLYQNVDVYEQLAHKLIKAMGKGTYLTKGVDMGHWHDFNQAIEAISKAGESKSSVLVIGSRDILNDWTVSDVIEGLPVLQTDTVVVLGNMQSPAALNQWSPQFLISCEDLPERFPFPFPDGTQLRPRPAYYYTQSAVIPFEQTDHGLQVLVIGSSKRKHFVVPKGIHEPGLSAQESAAKESLEEAGIMGPVSEKAIGSYAYSKWGAECTVCVYVQKVTEVLPESQWQERHRGRQWMSPGKAAAIVKQPELGQMIEQLEQFLLEELK